MSMNDATVQYSDGQIKSSEFVRKFSHRKSCLHTKQGPGVATQLRGVSKLMHPFDPTLKAQRPDREETGRANDSMIAAAARLWPATLQIYFARAARLSHSQWFAVNRGHRF